MKKTFIFILVLGMGALVDADLLFNVNGVDVPDGGTIDIPVGTVFELQVINEVMGDIGFECIRVDLTNATIAGPGIVYNENLRDECRLEAWGFDPAPMFWWILQWIQGWPPIQGEGPLFGIMLQCTEFGPVDVEIMDYSCEEVLASMTINQVPEPASLTLLAAGGLLLRRSFRTG
jgi:hypothetical protein